MSACENVIKGWELANLDPERFDMQIIELSEACKGCEYLDRCEIPAESVRQLTPKKGEVIQLGREYLEGEDVVDYYILTSEEGVRYIALERPKHSWATARYVSREQVPSWILARSSSLNH